MAQVNKAFATELLRGVNSRRARHGVPDLTLNQQLCAQAQSWADYLAEIGQFKHCRDRQGAGETLAYTSKVLSEDEYAQMWYGGSDEYNYNYPRFEPSTANFTQMVWKATREFGAGISTSQHGTYVVGRYTPMGNVVSNMKDNVLPPSK